MATAPVPSVTAQEALAAEIAEAVERFQVRTNYAVQAAVVLPNLRLARVAIATDAGPRCVEAPIRTQGDAVRYHAARGVTPHESIPGPVPCPRVTPGAQVEALDLIGLYDARTKAPIAACVSIVLRDLGPNGVEVRLDDARLGRADRGLVLMLDREKVRPVHAGYRHPNGLVTLG